ncbi:hypothetical protein FOL47_009781 [Perkinsus chesapeaki]|uniref:Integrase catalytic domain-containing protein n=1 Tax=Perkinsus chesapeaki TaxID=330153 RepID=A0A7J6L6G5_PERCH|nr:hypothetical protein FOL47_009781 [Perkinsus chesapeaki]
MVYLVNLLKIYGLAIPVSLVYNFILNLILVCFSGLAGRLVSHYPVASWLRVWASFLKRLACSSIEANAAWDTPLPASIRSCCEELYSRFSSDDAVSGVWSLPAKLPHVYDLFCDASSIAVGVVLKQGHYVLEDGSWLIPPSSQLHINLLELNATIRGLTLATHWNARKVVLHCDSRTVVSWLTSLLEETGPVRVSGLHETLIRRRLAIIAELLESAGICLTVAWIESQANPADLLTRVPQRWVSLYSSFSTRRVEEEGVGDGCIAQLEEDPTRQRQKVTSAAVTVMSPPTVSVQDQLHDPMLCEVRAILSRRPPVDPVRGAKLVPPPYRKVYPQLCIGRSKLFCRQLNVPPNVNVKVPVVPAAQIGEFIKWAHVEAGHGDWTGTWKLLRRSCYFPDMAVKAQQYIKDYCPSCRATRHHRNQATTGAATTIGDGPWDIIYADTLSMNGITYLVVTDSFTKWIEAIRLPRNDGRSVCNGLVRLCYRFGAPTVLRTDNGPEMANQYVDRLCAYYHIIHRRGAARHPQSQGSVERANKTILGILRKIIGEARSEDEVDLLVQQALYHYRLRTTATLGISPFLAMYGWEPRSTPTSLPSSFSWDLATWVDKQVYQRAWLNDYIDNVLGLGTKIPPITGDHMPVAFKTDGVDEVKGYNVKYHIEGSGPWYLKLDEQHSDNMQFVDGLKSLRVIGPDAHSALQQRYLARVSSLRRTPVALWSTLPFKLSTRGALSTESVSRLEYEVVKCIDGLLNGRLVDLSRDLPQLVNSLAKFAADPPSAEMLKSVTPFIAVIDVRRLPDHKTSLVGAFTEILLTLQALSSTHNSARSCTARLMSLERSLRSDLRSIGLTSENILSTEAPTSPSMEERHTLVRDQSVRDLTQGRRLLGKSSSTSMPRGGSKTAGHAFGRSISDKSIIIGTKPPSLATEARASIRKEVKASKSPPTDHRVNPEKESRRIEKVSSGDETPSRARDDILGGNAIGKEQVNYCTREYHRDHQVGKSSLTVQYKSADSNDCAFRSAAICFTSFLEPWHPRELATILSTFEDYNRTKRKFNFTFMLGKFTYCTLPVLSYAFASTDVSIDVYRDEHCFEKTDTVLLEAAGTACYANTFDVEQSLAFSIKTIDYTPNSERFQLSLFKDDCKTPESKNSFGSQFSVISGACEPILGTAYGIYSVRYRNEKRTCNPSDSAYWGGCSPLRVAVFSRYTTTDCSGMPIEVQIKPAFDGECLRAENGTQTYALSETSSNMTLRDFQGATDCLEEPQRTINVGIGACYPLGVDQSFRWTTSVRILPTAANSSDIG